jgi:hypothetical protein
MSGGSLQLREYPSLIVRLSCEKCGRAARYGADIRSPDLREEIDARRLPGSVRRFGA